MEEMHFSQQLIWNEVFMPLMNCLIQDLIVGIYQEMYCVIQSKNIQRQERWFEHQNLPNLSKIYLKW